MSDLDRVLAALERRQRYEQTPVGRAASVVGLSATEFRLLLAVVRAVDQLPTSLMGDRLRNALDALARLEVPDAG